ncbi:MAG: citramalate synthase, partial [Victivallales bacterium]|nr:citramalate synthase [Victivallales bacterium]
TEFFRELGRNPLQHSRLVAFGATHAKHKRPEEDANFCALAECCAPTAAIFGKSWLLHVREVLNVTPQENLELIAESVSWLRARGKEVIFEAEHFFDSYADNPEYALQVLQCAVNAGASQIVLCDTNGATLPYDVQSGVAAARQALPASVVLGIHCHNDSDCAVASSLGAVRSGCTMVQGTVNGFGERCGNADLCSIIPAVALKMPGFAVSEGLHLERLCRLSRLFYDLAVINERPQQPYVGFGAFAHKGGMHVNGVCKDARTFEHINPEVVGNRRQVLLSELSGASSVVMKARELDIELDGGSSVTRELLEEIKRREARGYAFEAADASFKLMVERQIHNHQCHFELDGFRVIIEKRGPEERCLSEATIKVRVNGVTELTAAEGEGPVNALDLALRKALAKFFPEVAEMRLNDFKVRIIDGADGTAAQTRVLVESKARGEAWTTVGVSENIIEASWQALLDSVEYFLLKNHGE